jgi:hypothetical protein
MPHSRTTQPKEDKRSPASAAKRSLLNPKKLEILDWIENLIVPTLVQMYLENNVLQSEVNRA